METSQVQQTSVYNGISNRSRGWKTWKSHKTSQLRSVNPTVMKWDGASRSSEVWDNLRRDPELWFRDGDCYVHLHGEGQSRRGAAFRVPFSKLLEANFQPLISKFLSRTRTDTARYSEGAGIGQIELFIPAPPRADKIHSYNYHLATRNLFAFIFRRSMVGECLGTALIALMHGLYRFRTPDVDNVQDLISYMDEEGYLNLNGQPTYALAILHLAEVFQLRELYIDAFAHCCGTGGRLFLAPEYLLLSQVTRTLIRRARREMHFRLGQASTMLKTFLRDEMCEINIELYPRAHEHLGRFRTLLQEVYTTYFGYYPPPSIDTQTTVFEADVFRTMRNDFEALYKFLLDGNFDIFQTGELLTETRICTLQSIKLFDSRYNHENLFHPLPLLPDTTQRKSSFWRMSRWSRSTKRNQLQRAETLAALSKATNLDRPDVVENHLVAAYQKFEEDQITFQTKADQLENQGLIDGRRIRWILVYAIYQTLLRATEVPSEIKHATGVPYHMCISTADLPPWKEEHPAHALVHTQLERTSSPPSRLSWRTLEPKSYNDCFILTSPATCNAKERPKSSVLENWSFKGGFENSVSRRLSEVRRSLGFLTRQGTERPLSEILKTPCREDIVHRDSSDVNHVVENKELLAETPSVDPAHPLSNRPINSSASVISNSSCNYSNSEAKTTDTPDTSVTGSPAQSPVEKWESQRATVCISCGLHDVDRDTASSSPRWSRPSRVEDISRGHSKMRATRPGDECLPTHLIRRSIIAQQRPREISEPTARGIRNAKNKSTSDLNIKMPSPQAPTAWRYIRAAMEVQASNYERQARTGSHQFTRLRDSVEVGSGRPPAAAASAFRRASAIF
ncbi:hypothetical protein F5Y12DRAFT_222938 [Xylaria sp. FL1777]|nr:hypothetical protein F5Y12DRAFT_222938 [Xylaria sp. FL1777]